MPVTVALSGQWHCQSHLQDSSKARGTPFLQWLCVPCPCFDFMSSHPCSNNWSRNSIKAHQQPRPHLPRGKVQPWHVPFPCCLEATKQTATSAKLAALCTRAWQIAWRLAKKALSRWDRHFQLCHIRDCKFQAAQMVECLRQGLWDLLPVAHRCLLAKTAQ